ncbi:uncharacterized protein [Phaseolus vulgaris]|uniref:DUF7081 domain-containing protein n=1 Tax=Phaseolus vulgaris TaxID=3885 RepID=V7AMJ0_PHAVU|nr:hypothetical protein PHAVU_010G080100g [Phaseolus vulgaris]ESW06827.1 hypothetical protein PHAVU_010G080100g [Phaseolus vulgaris]
MAPSHSPIPISCQDEEENDSPFESNPYKDKTFDLQPVSPYSSGEGLPYAPEGWPNPGDVWGWKVLSRTNKAGYFLDRHLYLPKSLQTSSSRRHSLRTKPDVERYIESNFPSMAIEAFFDLFSWQIPSTEKTPTKAVQSMPITPPVKPLQIEEDTTEEISTKRKLKRRTKVCSQPSRKISRLRVRVGQSLSPDQDANNILDLCLLDNEVAKVDATEIFYGNIDCQKGSGMQISGEKYPNVTTVLENFDDYLDNLEDLLVMPHSESSSDHMAPSTNTMDNQTIECCKKKLSSLLAGDFPSLVSCNNAVIEVAMLASQICKDATLSADQMAKLKLVEEIPLASVAFHEANGNIVKADRFLGDLEAKKSKVLSLKLDYKDKVAQIQSEIERNSAAIQEIDDQIQKLQSKRKEICGALESMQERKVELTCGEASVANSILTLVGEIQHGLSEKSKWERKKANSVQRVAEIQEKFTTLRGLTFF